MFSAEFIFPGLLFAEIKVLLLEIMECKVMELKF